MAKLKSEISIRYEWQIDKLRTPEISNCQQHEQIMIWDFQECWKQSEVTTPIFIYNMKTLKRNYISMKFAITLHATDCFSILLPFWEKQSCGRISLPSIRKRLTILDMPCYVEFWALEIELEWDLPPLLTYPVLMK